MYSIHALFDFQEGLFVSVPLVILFLLSLLTVASAFRWKLLKWKGFDLQEREIVYSSRQKNFSLESFTNKFSSVTLKVADGIPRKLYHFMASGGQILIGQIALRDIVFTAQTFILANALIFVLALASYGSNRKTGFAGIIYGGTNRIRDGELGRLNNLIARVGTICAMLAVSLLGMQFIHNVPVKDHQFLVLLIYVPVVVGDAMGEIIGSFWGRHEFKVYGVGSINKKSLEGTLAVFGSTFLVLGVLTATRGEYFLLALVISLVSTIVETFSPRSTDNFFIPLFNCLILSFYFNVLG